MLLSSPQAYTCLSLPQASLPCIRDCIAAKSAATSLSGTACLAIFAHGIAVIKSQQPLLHNTEIGPRLPKTVQGLKQIHGSPAIRFDCWSLECRNSVRPTGRLSDATRGQRIGPSGLVSAHFLGPVSLTGNPSRTVDAQTLRGLPRPHQHPIQTSREKETP